MDRKRVLALDGLRGVLAFVVLINHIYLFAAQSNLLFWPARLAVFGFFVISAHVLVRAWCSTDPVTFGFKRIVRLWPTYAAGALIGAAVTHTRISADWLFWPPIVLPVDPPAWSLAIEVRAMIFMPLLVWASRGHWLRPVSLALAWTWLTFPTSGVGFGLAFLMGARLSRYDFQSRLLESKPALWLGQISYSLYLCHFALVKVLCLWNPWLGAALALPVSLALGWLLWWSVERPSIVASQWLGRSLRGRMRFASA